MRVVGGRLRGRSLASPVSAGTRPTQDRLRESIFDILAHGHDDPVSGARVLDLFAGTGAMGIEALSRGAEFATFVDEAAAARGVIRQNVEALGLGGMTRLFRRDATRMGPAGANLPVSLVFCDPPYGRDLAPDALASCAQGGWIRAGATIVVEEAADAPIELPQAFTELDRRRYGGTAVLFARYLA